VLAERHGDGVARFVHGYSISPALVEGYRTRLKAGGGART